MPPARFWLLTETISANYRQAWAYAEAMPTVVAPALELFMANMDIEGRAIPVPDITSRHDWISSRRRFMSPTGCGYALDAFLGADIQASCLVNPPKRL